MQKTSLVIFLSILAGMSDGAVREYNTSRHQLMRDLMSNYDKMIRPVTDAERAVNLSYGAALYQLVDFDVKMETIRTLLWQRLYWTDEFLIWDPADYDGVEKIRLSQMDVWTPDLLPYNDVGVYDSTKYMRTVPLSVTNEGYIQWLNPVALETTCIMDVTDFPFDTQKCFIEIGTWQFKATEVDIFCAAATFDETSYVDHTQWTLLGTSCERVDVTYASGSYNSLTFTVEFERLRTFYVRNILLPNAVLLALSSLTFFMPSGVGERVSFGVTILLALCVNLIVVIDFIPETSRTIPNICNYFLVSIFLSGISIFWATISINVNHWAGTAAASRPVKNEKEDDKISCATKDEKETSKPKEALLRVKRKLGGFLRFITRADRLHKYMPVLDITIGMIYFIMTTIYTLVFLLSQG